MDEQKTEVTKSKKKFYLLTAFIILLLLAAGIAGFVLLSKDDKDSDSSTEVSSGTETGDTEEVVEEDNVDPSWLTHKNPSAGIEFRYPATFDVEFDDYYSSLFYKSDADKTEILIITNDKVMSEAKLDETKALYEGSLEVNPVEFNGVTINKVAFDSRKLSYTESVQSADDPCMKDINHTSYFINNLTFHDINLSQLIEKFQCQTESTQTIVQTDFDILKQILATLKLKNPTKASAAKDMQTYTSPNGFVTFQYDKNVLGQANITTNEVTDCSIDGKPTEIIEFSSDILGFEINQGCGRGGYQPTGFNIDSYTLTTKDGKTVDVGLWGTWDNLSALDIYATNATEALQIYSSFAPVQGNDADLLKAQMKEIVESMTLGFSTAQGN